MVKPTTTRPTMRRQQSSKSMPPQNRKTHMIPKNQNLGSENENTEDNIVKDDQGAQNTRDSVDTKENSENLNSDESGKL